VIPEFRTCLSRAHSAGTAKVGPVPLLGPFYPPAKPSEGISAASRAIAGEMKTASGMAPREVAREVPMDFGVSPPTVQDLFSASDEEVEEEWEKVGQEFHHLSLSGEVDAAELQEERDRLRLQDALSRWEGEGGRALKRTQDANIFEKMEKKLENRSQMSALSPSTQAGHATTATLRKREDGVRHKTQERPATEVKEDERHRVRQA